MNFSCPVDTILAVANLDRREWMMRALASGALVSLSSVLAACNSSNSRSRNLVGQPIPDNPVPVRARTAPVGPAGSNRVATGVLPRSRWTRSAPELSLADPMRGISQITIHHDGMPPVSLSSMNSVASRIEQIRASHRQRGWADIGYHYVIDPDGRVWEGRPIKLQGAHVKDQNPQNLGILVLGNFEQQTPTPRATAALDDFLVGQMRQYRIPVSRVYTHQELASTACPGRALQRYMESTRARGGRVAMA